MSTVGISMWNTQLKNRRTKKCGRPYSYFAWDCCTFSSPVPRLVAPILQSIVWFNKYPLDDRHRASSLFPYLVHFHPIYRRRTAVPEAISSLHQSPCAPPACFRSRSYTLPSSIFAFSSAECVTSSMDGRMKFATPPVISVFSVCILLSSATSPATDSCTDRARAG